MNYQDKRLNCVALRTFTVDGDNHRQLGKAVVQCSNSAQAFEIARTLANVEHVQAIHCARAYDVFGRPVYLAPSELILAD